MTLPLLMTIVLNNFLIAVLAALCTLIPIAMYHVIRDLPSGRAFAAIFVAWVLGASAGDVAVFYLTQKAPAAPAPEAGDVECPISDLSDGLGSEVSQ